MDTTTGIDPHRVRTLLDDEDARFVDARPETMRLREQARRVMPNGVPMSWHATDNDPPIYVAEGHGSGFTDVDGHDYVDFNIADISMFCGYGPEPVVRAVASRAATGTQFLLPSPESIAVATELARRWPLPRWQFTLSASQANVEAIRIARAATGRDKVVWFDGKYHGHFDDALVRLGDGIVRPEQEGLPAATPERSRIVPWNDPDALARALAPGDVAAVVTEPALTNTVGLLLPEPGFHDAIRSLTRDAGSVLIYDETHTLVTGPAGLVGHWGLEPDVVTVGKSIAGGIPIGAYGLSTDLSDLLEDPERDVATGGTLFGNPLQMAAAQAALTEVLTDDAYAHTSALGTRLADGLAGAIASAGLEWTVHRLWARSGVTFGPHMPRDAADARSMEDPLLTKLARRWLANRGVWEAIAGAGPTVSVPCSEEDVDRYLDAYDALLVALTRR